MKVNTRFSVQNTIAYLATSTLIYAFWNPGFTQLAQVVAPLGIHYLLQPSGKKDEKKDIEEDRNHKSIEDIKKDIK